MVIQIGFRFDPPRDVMELLVSGKGNLFSRTAKIVTPVRSAIWSS